MSNKDSAAPNRMKLLRAIELPTIAHSSRDNVAARREQPKIDNADPKRANDLREKEAPTKPTS